MDSWDEELFGSLLEARLSVSTEYRDEPSKVDKTPKDELEDGTLEYLSSDAIYQMLYKAEIKLHTGEDKCIQAKE